MGNRWLQYMCTTFQPSCMVCYDGKQVVFVCMWVHGQGLDTVVGLSVARLATAKVGDCMGGGGTVSTVASLAHYGHKATCIRTRLVRKAGRMRLAALLVFLDRCMTTSVNRGVAVGCGSGALLPVGLSAVCL